MKGFGKPPLSRCCPTAPVDVRAPLFFALVAERLYGFYSRDQWVGDARAREVADVWLSRENNFSLSYSLKTQLLALSDSFAREIAEALSREAGSYIAHEMMESLDSHYVSQAGDQMKAECERILKEKGLLEPIT